jgi:hypothetical protein
VPIPLTVGLADRRSVAGRPTIASLPRAAWVGLVVLLVLAGAAMVFIPGTARQGALSTAEGHAQALIRDGVQPALQRSDLQRPIGATRSAEITGAVGGHSGADPVLRVTVWRPDGLVVFSTEPSVVGQRFADERDALGGVAKGDPHSDVRVAGEGALGGSLPLTGSVYVTRAPVKLGGTTVAVVEVVQDYSSIIAAADGLSHAITVGVLVALALFAFGAMFLTARRAGGGAADRRRSAETGGPRPDPLKDEMRRLRVQLRETAAAKADAEQRMADATARIEDAEGRTGGVQQELHAAQAELQQLRDTLEEAKRHSLPEARDTANREELLDELKMALTKVQATDSERGELNRQVRRLQGEVAVAEKRAHKAENGLEATAARADQLEAVARQAEQEARAQSTKAAESDRQLQETVRHLEEAVRRAEEADARALKTREEAGPALSRAEEAEARVQSLEQQLRQTQEAAHATEEAARRSADELREAASATEALSTRHQEELQAVESRAAAAEERARGSESRLEAATAQVGQLEGRTRRLEEQLQAATSGAGDQLKKALARSSQSDARAAEAERRTTELEARANQADRIAAEAQARVDAAEKEIRSARAKVEKAEKKVVRLEAARPAARPAQAPAPKAAAKQPDSSREELKAALLRGQEAEARAGRLQKELETATAQLREYLDDEWEARREAQDELREVQGTL